jgi:hypothetical protein
MRKRYDPMELIGNEYGRLTVREYLGHDDDAGLAMFRCSCSCQPGAEKIASRKNLVNGSVKSCGCLRREARPKESQTRFFTPELKRATAMRGEPQIPYKIVIHR